MSNDSKSILGGIALGVLFGMAWIAVQPRPAPAPAPAPVQAPACNGCASPCDGGSCKRPDPPKRFNVTCPHCRQPLTVLPPNATGDIGATVVGEKK